ncbi:MAG: ABC transporter permease [Thermomicrobiales bacterium]|nr:ABC transporter permease [Thermomicrobiales bacterium]
MDLLGQTWTYIVENAARVQEALLVHLALSLGALAIGMLIFIPLGVLSSLGGKLTAGIVGVVAAVRVIPSLAVILLLMPFFGLGWKPALVALTLLAGPPLVINTDTGLRGVDPATLEAATGLGLTASQRFRRVKLPLALPVIVAGIRTAAIEVIGSATLAAFVGAGGLGTFITSGITLMDERMLLTGAILVTLLALATEGILARVERWITPPGTTPA